MYLRILKKDLSRKKAMNVIILIFIILSTMFVSSSINNILSVTSALDDYLEMTKAPDYLIATTSKNLDADVDEVLRSSAAVDSYEKENMLFLYDENFDFEGKDISLLNYANIVQSNICLNYFLPDATVLTEVTPGSFYMTENKAKELGIEIGDRLTIELSGVTRTLTLENTVKDAVFGSNQIGLVRYIISDEDYGALLSDDSIDKLYGGNIIYVYSSDVESAVSDLKPLVDKSFFVADRDFIKFTYIFDMIITGILLIVSIVLIAIAFAVLRFTISFTVSEEFREIGIMKAIGIPPPAIRRLYVIKYAILSLIGAAIGLLLSFPFGNLIMKVASPSIILGGSSHILINLLSSLLVIIITLLFCYASTRKIKKMSPLAAVRSENGKMRVTKRKRMSLAKSRLPKSSFLAINDIKSAPRRYGIMTLTFLLCFSLMLILSSAVYTMKSGSLAYTFGQARCDVYFDMSESFATEDGEERAKLYLAELEESLAENGMPAECYQERFFSLPVSSGTKEINVSVTKAIGTEMDMYEYTKGTAPLTPNEIAITKMTAEDLGVGIGDTVTITAIDGKKDYKITAYFQSMSNFGEGIRLHSDERINFVQTISTAVTTQIRFTDSPSAKEIESRIERIKELYPNFKAVESEAERIADYLSVTDTLDSLKAFVTVLTVILIALVTVLMERSFIARERGEIALMKALGIRSATIYGYHCQRFLLVGLVAVVLGEILSVPLTMLAFDPIFKMMGLESRVNYLINPPEMFFILPLTVLAITAASASLASLQTKSIKLSDTANIE